MERTPVAVTVRLVINTVVFPITDSFFQAVVGSVFPFLCSGVYRDSVISRSSSFENIRFWETEACRKKIFKIFSGFV